MDQTSTPRVNRRAPRQADERHPRPSRLTMLLIRQFARVYTPTATIDTLTAGIPVN